MCHQVTGLSCLLYFSLVKCRDTYADNSVIPCLLFILALSDMKLIKPENFTSSSPLLKDLIRLHTQLGMQTIGM